MTRGTGMERTLAIIGIVLWAVGALLEFLPPRRSVVFAVLSVGLFVWSIWEFRAWQSRGVAKRTGKDVFPRVALFAIGAVPAVFVFEFVRASVGATPSSAGSLDPLFFIVWIVAGEITQRFLAKNAERGEATRERVPAMPPPPPPHGSGWS